MSLSKRVLNSGDREQAGLPRSKVPWNCCVSLSGMFSVTNRGNALSKEFTFYSRFSVFLPKTIDFLDSTLTEWWSEAHFYSYNLSTPMYLWATIEEDFQTLDLNSIPTEELYKFTAGVTPLSSSCASLLKRLVCPAVLLLRKSAVESCLWIVADRRKRGTDVQRVVPRNTIITIIEKLLNLLKQKLQIKFTFQLNKITFTILR